MPLVHRQVSQRQVAANQANAQNCTGPKTPPGKARASLNALKHGAYAKSDNCRREILLRRGEDPAQYEQLQQDLVDSWQPDDVMQALLSQGVGGQALVVKTIVDKTWHKLQLQGSFLENQVVALRAAPIQAQRQQLLARRWPEGVPAAQGRVRGLSLAKDSYSKFQRLLELLGRLQEWHEKETCPDEYPEVMDLLYGEYPTAAGRHIRDLFRQLFDDDEAVCAKARQELGKWIAQERRDVEQERELYEGELRLQGSGALRLSEDLAAAKEATLERQIAAQSRLLLQLKSKRSLWASPSEGGDGKEGEESAPQSVGDGQGSDSQRHAVRRKN